MAKERDPFDSLLGLEDDFYKEGFDLGVKVGKQAGLIDGRLFGLENGFEKYIAMGRLHGRATVWAGRLPGNDNCAEQAEVVKEESQKGVALLRNPRLKTHVRTLYALTEPGSLSTENSEDSVADFDDRLKRAEGKFKVIEKLTGETNQEDEADRASKGSKATGNGGIEDTSVLSVRD